MCSFDLQQLCSLCRSGTQGSCPIWVRSSPYSILIDPTMQGIIVMWVDLMCREWLVFWQPMGYHWLRPRPGVHRRVLMLKWTLRPTRPAATQRLCTACKPVPTSASTLTYCGSSNNSTHLHPAITIRGMEHVAPTASLQPACQPLLSQARPRPPWMLMSA